MPQGKTYAMPSPAFAMPHNPSCGIMAESVHPFYGSYLARIEPDDRVVVLARTIQARGTGAEAALNNSALDWARFGETCLGQALYRHNSVFGTLRKRPCGAISN
jgi:hypothetical protein